MAEGNPQASQLMAQAGQVLARSLFYSRLSSEDLGANDTAPLEDDASWLEQVQSTKGCLQTLQGAL
jgi:hypothetical protein